MKCSQAILCMYAVSWREGGGKQANVHAIVTSPEISINEAEPIYEVVGLVTPALSRPGDEAEV